MLHERAIEEAVAARRAAEAEIDTLRNDLMLQSQEREKASRAFEDELMEIETRLDKALTGRNMMEKQSLRRICLSKMFSHCRNH